MKTKTFLLLMLWAGWTSCKTAGTAVQAPVETTSIEGLQSVEVRGEKMHYVQQGSGEPIILVHGAISDYSVWSLQMDTLAENYRVIAISRRYARPNWQPAAGESFDCTVALHARDLVAFMQALDISSAHLMGHSYGAMIILRTAIDHPNMIKSLILGEPAVETMLSGTAKGDSVIAGFRASADVAVKHYQAGEKEKAMRAFLTTVLGSDEVYDVVPQAVRDGWLQNLVEGICISETKDLASISAEELIKINIPTLLIKGEYSPAYLAWTSDSLNVAMPNSRLTLLPEASHGLQGEKPEEYNKAVLEFLQGLE